MFIYTNVLGSFIINEKFEIVETSEFNDEKDAISNLCDLSKEGTCKNQEKLQKKHESAVSPKGENLNKILCLFKADAKRFFSFDISVTKNLIKNFVGRDELIIQAVRTIEELDKNINSLSKKLRDWFSLYSPEIEKAVHDNEAFADIITKDNVEEFKKKLEIKETMGADFKKEDYEMILQFSNNIISLFDLRKKQLEYIEKVMDEICPNLKTVAGASIGAKLLEHAGSLRRMVNMPASTIQLLGAETALFRHLKTGSRSPKHGLIINHQLVSVAKKKNRGKAARILADKISIAVKIDYFKGEFIGDKLKAELEKKLK